MMFRFRYSVALPLLLMPFCLSAQVDRKEVRAGNRHYDKGNWQKAEIEYRKAQVKDTASFAANFNLSDALYRQENYEEAGKALERLKDTAPESVNAADYYYNLGNVACMKKDWEAAVEAYKQSLLRNPGDVEAKENLAYATAMLKKEILTRTITTTRTTRTRARARTTRRGSRTRVRTTRSSNNLLRMRRRYPLSRPSRC